MSDYSAKIHIKQDADELVIESGGEVGVESGGKVGVESGGEVDIKTGGKILANGTQANHIADASTAHDLNATFSDTEVEAALNALGTKINAILVAIEGAGITKTS